MIDAPPETPLNYGVEVTEYGKIKFHIGVQYFSLETLEGDEFGHHRELIARMLRQALDRLAASANNQRDDA